MRVVVLTLLLACAAPVAGAQEWRFDTVQAWQALERTQGQARAVTRAALVWLAWDVATASEEAASALRCAGLPPASPLRPLWEVSPPPRVVGPAEDERVRDLVAPLVDLVRHLEGQASSAGDVASEVACVVSSRALFVELGPALEALAPAGGPGPRYDAARALSSLLAAVRGSERLVGLRGPVVDALDLVARLDVARGPDAPAWLGGVLVEAVFGGRAYEVDERLLAPLLGPRLSDAVRAWWDGGLDAAAVAGVVASIGSALPAASPLRADVATVASGLAWASSAGWRPPTWAEWSRLDPATRLRALDVALCAGAAPLPLPRDAPRLETVAERLGRAGWSALPLLVARATDGPLGPGAAARALVRVYAGSDADAHATRSAWWERWRDEGPAPWWGQGIALWLPAHREAERGAVLERAVDDLGVEAAPILIPQFERSWRYPGAAQREPWVASILEVERRRGSTGLLALVDSWLDAPELCLFWGPFLRRPGSGPSSSSRVRRVADLVRQRLPAHALGALLLLVDQDLPVAITLGDELAGTLWRDELFVASLAARDRRRTARLTLLRVAALALRAGDERAAASALAPLVAGEELRVDELAAAAFELESTAAPTDPESEGSLRRTALLLGELPAASLQRVGRLAGESLARDLASGDPALVEGGAADVARIGPSTRSWLEELTAGEVAPLGSDACLTLASATPGRALVEPLAGRVRAWTAITARDVVELLAAWRADPAGGAGLEVGLSRAPRGRFAARVRPLAAGGAPATFRLETDGVRQDTIVSAGEVTDAAIADALASAIVDLLLAPEALVDLRLRVWR